MQILSHAGILVSCTTSHRCDIYLNGQTVTGRTVLLDYGDFIQIEAFPMSPPGSEDEDESPAPLAGIRSPSCSTTTSSSEEESAASTSESSAIAGPDEYTQVVHCYRPLLGERRPARVHAVIPPGSRTWRTAVLEAWPRLRYAAWGYADVHPSLYRDFPQQDDVYYKVIVVPGDLTRA